MRDYRSDIEWRSVDSIIPYANNTKQHPEGQVAKIAGSIAEFGFDQPIVIDGQSVLIKGHGRLLAARKLGLTQVPVLIRTDLTPTQVKAARLADNKVAESSWDQELLKLELVELKASDFDLGLTGFDPIEVDELLSANDYLKETIEADEPVSRADECQQKWQVEVGDLWRCGDHLIWCGDCTQQEEVRQKLLKDQLIHLLLTDPPYGVRRDKGFTGNEGFRGKKLNPILRRSYSDCWDNERPTKETFDFLISCTQQSIIWGGNFFADLLPMSTHWLVWDKHQTMPTFGDCELAWTNIDRKSVKKYDVEYNGLIGKEKDRYHPTQKPVKLFSQLIDDYTDVSDCIFDPYSGSGTTLIAAEQAGRKALLIELSPSYVSVALERWSQLMNQTPVKV